MDQQHAFEAFSREVDWIDIPIGEGEDQIPLKLRRLQGKHGSDRAVVILHGGNSSSDTFLLPGGGLAAFLRREGWDVWLLDWRGSPYVVEPILERTRPLGGTELTEREIMSLDRAAAEDVPRALDHVRKAIGDAHLSLMGHCIAGGLVSMAVARRQIPESARVTDIVLTTMSLFYEVPWDGWVKAEDFLLERSLQASPGCRGINPRKPEEWPGPFDEAFKRWPATWRCFGKSGADELLSRLTFMVGKPWSPARLAEGLHGPVLEPVFATMHMGIYIQSGQLVRRGFSAKYDAPDVIDRTRLDAKGRGRSPALLKGDLDPAPFMDKYVTLISASENRVWHRDSIDLMYEWLLAHAEPEDTKRFKKEVVLGYNLQELYWGKNAAMDSYPVIERSLRRSFAPE